MTREEAIEWFETHMPTKLMPVAKKAYEMAVFALTHQQGEWISVKDRLPEKKQRVIVRCRTVGTTVGWILWREWLTDLGKGCSDVTHWMPLPEPPERYEDE